VFYFLTTEILEPSRSFYNTISDVGKCLMERREFFKRKQKIDIDPDLPKINYHDMSEE